MGKKTMIFLATLFTGFLLCVSPVLAQQDNTAVIKAATVYLRQEPSFVSERSVSISAGTQVYLLEEAGQWSRVNYNGRVGWIPDTALLKTGAEAIEETETSPAALLKPDNQQAIIGLQELLQYLGYYQGEANGVYDAALQDAVKSYQKANAMEESGQADQETLNRMLLEQQLLEAIVNTALEQQGIPYHYANASPKNGFDCSGLTYYVYAQYGYKLNRTARGQLSDGVPVKPENIRPGDLIIFGNGNHVGMYVGNHEYIHAPYTGEVVKVQALTRKYIGIRRLVGGAP